MEANKVLTSLIMLKSIAITLLISVRSMYEAHRGFLRRDRIDRRLRWWSARLLDYVRLSVSLVNPYNVRFEQGKPTIIMSNHSSLYDIPITFVTLPGSIRMLTKKELFQFPIWGKGMRAAEFISIDRDNRRQAFRDLQEAKKKMESGIVLWVAPEGTRSRTGELGSFKKGGFMLASRTGATIVPVGIRGANRVLPAKTSRFHLNQRVEVHVGEPIEASAFDRKNLEGLMKEVELRIRSLMGDE